MYRYQTTTTIPNWLARYISPTKEFEKCYDKYSNAGLAWIRMYMEAKYGKMMSDLVCLKNEPMFWGSTINVIMEKMYGAEWRRLGADMTDFHKYPRRLNRIMKNLALDKTIQRVLMNSPDVIFKYDPGRTLVRQICPNQAIVEICEKMGLYDVDHMTAIIYGKGSTPKKQWFKPIPGIGLKRAKALEKVIFPKSRWFAYQDLVDEYWEDYEL